jgi:hypothetical protein
MPYKASVASRRWLRRQTEEVGQPALSGRAQADCTFRSLFMMICPGVNALPLLAPFSSASQTVKSMYAWRVASMLWQ